MIYLACPYYHEDIAIRRWRFERVTEALALLVAERRIPVYSPITMTHPMHMVCIERGIELPDTHEFWVGTLDFPFLRNCSSLAILMLPSWNQSVGVKMELDEAMKLRLAIEFLLPTYDEGGRIELLEQSGDLYLSR